MPEQLGEGQVKFSAKDETAPGVKAAQSRIESMAASMKSAATGGIGAVQKGLTATVGVMTGFIGTVTAVIGAMTLFYNIGKKVGEALFGVGEKAEEAGARIEDALGESIKRATANAAKLGVVLGTIGLEEDRRRIEELGKQIEKLNDDIGEGIIRKGFRGYAEQDLERERSKIVAERERLVRRIGEIEQRLRRQYETKQAEEEAAKAKEKVKDSKEAAEETADIEVAQVERVDDAREAAHRAHLARIDKENAARLRGINDLIAAEERLRDMQERQVSGFAAGRGAHDLSRIVDTLDRLDRKVNYTTGRRF